MQSPVEQIGLKARMTAHGRTRPAGFPEIRRALRLVTEEPELEREHFRQVYFLTATNKRRGDPGPNTVSLSSP
jgi:hypothetical protein